MRLVNCSTAQGVPESSGVLLGPGRSGRRRSVAPDRRQEPSFRDRTVEGAASALTGRARTVGVDVAHHADLRAVVAHLVEHRRKRVVAASPGMSRVVAFEHLVGGVLERVLEGGPAVRESRHALVDGGDDRVAPHAVVDLLRRSGWAPDDLELGKQAGRGAEVVEQPVDGCHGHHDRLAVILVGRKVPVALDDPLPAVVAAGMLRAVLAPGADAPRTRVRLEVELILGEVLPRPVEGVHFDDPHPSEEQVSALVGHGPSLARKSVARVPHRTHDHITNDGMRNRAGGPAPEPPIGRARSRRTPGGEAAMSGRCSNETVSVAVSVQASPRDRESWLALAADVESAGFEGLYVGDHPGVAPDPFVALGAAAAVTERVRLGTCVLNAGVWEPIPLANAVATLDVVSCGRAVLGVGAGHAAHEWTARGLRFPTPGARVGRLVELLEATRALLNSSESVSRSGNHFTLDKAALSGPRPVQARVPVMVGGNGDRVLRFGADHADIVGITGLGRALENGHRHGVDWSPPAIERTVEVIALQQRRVVGLHNSKRSFNTSN